jgi:TonB family protein
MKQKIKIMEQKPEPSDNEIRRYMNFDRLLEDRKIALNSAKTLSFFKWSIPALIITGTVVWYLWMRIDEPKPIQEQRIGLSDTAQHFQKNSPVIVRDSAIQEGQAPPIPSNEKNKSAAVSESNAQNAKEQTTTKENEILARESDYVQAEPSNGYSDLYNFFNTHLNYPSEALKDSTQGIQTISFIINEMGKPEQIAIVNSLGEPFDKESKRLIENMPAWKPATLNGKPVPSKVSIPITFQIQKIKN